MTAAKSHVSEHAASDALAINPKTTSAVPKTKFKEGEKVKVTDKDHPNYGTDCHVTAVLLVPKDSGLPQRYDPVSDEVAPAGKSAFSAEESQLVTREKP